MSEAVATATRESGQRGLALRMAWRNLWRNRRRTWLTAGAMAFACLLVGAGISLQAGSYKAMIETATGMLMGQVQVSNSAFIEDQKLEDTVVNATDLMRRLEAVPGVRVAPRAEAFALVSRDERAFGGLVVGVDFEREKRVITFFNQVSRGRTPVAAEEVLIGSVMARNLGADLGEEIVVLGTAKQGGIAAMALVVVGIFESGQRELDRTMMFTPLRGVQDAFELGDEVHRFVIRADGADLSSVVRQLEPLIGQDSRARTWSEFMPEVVQAIELDRVSAQIMYGVLLVLVSFSVVNTFMMIVFERMREFGMLLAIGMRPALIVRQILLEAGLMWCVGCLLGSALVVALVGSLAGVGIPIEGMEDLAGEFFLPDRIYPAFDLLALTAAPIVLFIGTQLAGFIATFRVNRIQPVAALRAE